MTYGDKHTRRQALRRINASRTMPRYVPHMEGSAEWDIMDTKRKARLGLSFPNLSAAKEFICDLLKTETETGKD